MDKLLLEGLIDSMQDLETRSPYFKGMIYGESGVGKTILALKVAQAITPKNQTIVFVDTVEGWVSALNHKNEGLLDRCIRMPYKGLSQIAALVQAKEEGIEPFVNAGCIILDEASTIARIDLDVALKARAKSSQDKDVDAPTWPDMNINTHRMRMSMLDLLTKDLHVILVSHLREDENKRTGKLYTRPDFMPKLSKSIREMVHLVGHMTSALTATEEGDAEYVRSIQVYPTDHIVAKTRVGGMGIDANEQELCIAISEWVQGNGEDLDNNTPLEDTDSLFAEENDEAVKEVEDAEQIGIVVP